MKKILKLLSLVLSGILLLTCFILPASASSSSTSDSILTQNDLNIAFEQIVPSSLITIISEPESYGISYAEASKAYIAQPFSIADFDSNNIPHANQSIAYYPICYNNKILLILTIYKVGSSVNCSIGKDFALPLSEKLSKSECPVYLFAKDSNIYCASRTTIEPLQINNPANHLMLTKLPDDTLDCSADDFPPNTITNLDLFISIETLLSNQPMPTATGVVNLPNYPIVYQGSYNICWAACVASMVRFLRPNDYPNLSAQQVCDKMGTGYNAANIETAKKALIKYLPFYYIVTIKGSRLTKSEVMKEIDKGKPVYTFWAAVSGGMGHAMSLYGYQNWAASSFQINFMEPTSGRKTLNMSDSDVQELVMGNTRFRWTNSVRV